MDMRQLGRTDLYVSTLCLGTMTWGEQNSEDEAHAQMDMAFDYGINFFDTAEMYPIPRRAETKGRTEEIIGTWFATRRAREHVVLATKIVGRDGGDWFRAEDKITRLTRKQFVEALDGSLKRLRTDHVDLYQLHWPDRLVTGFGGNPVVYKAPPRGSEEVAIGEQLDVLSDLVRAGKIRHIGLSNESAWGTMRFLAESEIGERPRVQSIQNAYSLLNRTFETGLAEIALREQVGLLAYSPLGQGVLTGKYLGGARPAGARKTLFNSLARYEKPGAEPAIAAYVALAHELEIDAAQMALKFVATRPFVTSTIIGATTLDQLAANIGSGELDWTDELESRISDIHLMHTNPCP